MTWTGAAGARSLPFSAAATGYAAHVEGGTIMNSHLSLAAVNARQQDLARAAEAARLASGDRPAAAAEMRGRFSLAHVKFRRRVLGFMTAAKQPSQQAAAE